MRIIVVGHTLFTMAMFGLMWTVQVVVYPQFRNVAPADLATYVADHGSRITLALALLAPAEVGFAAWLWLNPPTGLSRNLVFVSGALLAAGWVMTAAWFGPLHGRLQGAFEADRVTLLIVTNWFRTGIWTGRALLAGWFLWQLLEPEA